MGYQAIPMGCGGGKEEKTDAPQGEWVDHWAKLAFHVEKKTKPKKIIAAINEMLNTVDRGCEEKMQIEALVPLWTPDYSAFDAEKKLVKQLKHSTNSEGEPHEGDKKCKPKKIIAAVNKLLEEHGMQVEQLVPLWTPDYTALESDKKLIKQLKHSAKGDNDDYDAREEDPVRLIAVDMEQFDANIWNEHLDFGGDEFEKHEISFEDLEDSDASDSSDGNLTIQVGIRVVY